MKKRKVGRRQQLGMTLMEVSITIAILGALALLAAPAAAKLIRRSQALAAYSSMQQVLASARMQAVKRGVNVVVEFSLTPEKKIRAHTFQDRISKETPLTPAEEALVGNFRQDANEPTLGDVILPSAVAVWKYLGTKDDTGAGIAFDEYNDDATLIDRVAFLPTGGIAPPEDTATSGLPTLSGGRGIYFADAAGKNFFRVTVDSDVSGRLRVDKYMATTTARYPTAGYRPSEWQWY